MKKDWTTPQLTVYGSVEKLTQDKGFSIFGDAVIFGGNDDDDTRHSSHSSL